MAGRVLITGGTSAIARAFIGMLPGHEQPVTVGRHDEADLRADLASLDAVDAIAGEIAAADRILIAHGEIGTARFRERPGEEILRSLTVNLLSAVRIAEIAIATNPNARIAIVGSESGRKGSFDIAYALAKGALERYVEERRLPHPQQQLVCVAPALIEDGGMTLRRSDQDRVRAGIESHPKGRGLRAAEVAAMLHHLLYVDEGYTTNTVIRMDGGKFARS